MLCVQLLQELFRLETPGGGGYGDKNSMECSNSPPAKKARIFTRTGSVADYVYTQESA